MNGKKIAKNHGFNMVANIFKTLILKNKSNINEK